jgi:actin related protein 2/3 complex subunit 2
MLIFVELVHPAVVEAVRRMVSGESDVGDCIIREFDGCEYHIAIGEDGASISVSMRHMAPRSFFTKHCAAELAEVLSRHFPDGDAGGAVANAKPLPGMVVTVVVPLDAEDPASVIASPRFLKAAQLRVTCLVAPFAACFTKFLAGDHDFALRVPFREAESFYLYAAKGNFTATMSFLVPNRDDQMYVRNFLYEMAEAKKHDRSTAAGPGFLFRQAEAPPMPKEIGVAEADGDENIFWCSFILSTKHMAPAAKAEDTVRQLANFHQFVMLHMQCTRSMMHAKMRDRVKTSLQVLNRAKTSTTGRAKIRIK